MNAPIRAAHSCPFRRDVSTGGERVTICECLRRLFGDKSVASCRVESEECTACCEYPPPSGAQLNPIVASIAYSRSEVAAQRTPRADLKQFEYHQIRLFARKWLRSPPALEHQAVTAHDAATLRNGRRDSERPNRLAPVKNPRREPRVGLVGPFTPFGLGHQNRDLAFHLNVDRWLIWGARTPSANHLECRLDALSRPMSPPELEAWLEGLDVVIFVETPCFPDLTQVARALGVKIVCVPNWEWLHTGLNWLDDVDVMLCPTRHTLSVLQKWQSSFCFGWQLEYVPWPVDIDRFEFRQRRVCERFVYINGSGGQQATRRDDAGTVFLRKGLQTLLAAAEMVPEIPILIYACSQDVPSRPPNVDLRPPREQNWQLYREGDVCIQPSHWEGLGLPLLECQAAGMPLITVDSPPMSEHRPLAVIPIDREEVVDLDREFCIPAAQFEPGRLAGVMRTFHKRNIASASRKARKFIERNHSWKVGGPRINQTLRRLASTSERSRAASVVPLPEEDTHR